MSVLIVLSVCFHRFICLSQYITSQYTFSCVNDCEAHLKQKPDSDMHIKKKKRNAGVMPLIAEHSPYSDLSKPLALVV